MTTPPAEPKPRKKPKWYWHVVNIFFWLWLLGGVKVLLLQDIPLLLFLVGVGIALIYPTTWWQQQKTKAGMERSAMTVSRQLTVITLRFIPAFVSMVSPALFSMSSVDVHNFAER